MTKDEALAEALELINCWVRGGNPEDYWQEIDTVADAVKDALEGSEQGQIVLAQEVIGCFHAAEVEGLTAALANTTDEYLKDLIERRLMHALYAAQETQEEENEGN